MSETKNYQPTQDGQALPEKSRIPNATIINVVLFIGLIVLYVFNFFPRGGSADLTEAGIATQEEISDMATILADGAFNIAFVNSDSLMARYKLAQRMQTEFEAEQRRLDNDLQRRQRTFQEDVESFQRQIQLGMISMEDAQRREQELMMEQQNLLQLNDTYSTNLMRKEMEMNRELYQKITDLLERFNREMGFDYILGFSPGGGILYAHQKHDITNEIVRRLNQEYDAQN